MGFYADVIRLIDLAEEHLSVSDLNTDDVLASLKGDCEPELQKGSSIPSCPANNVIIRLEALFEHCVSISQKTSEINEMLNGHCRDRESAEQIKKQVSDANITGAINAKKIKPVRK